MKNQKILKFAIHGSEYTRNGQVIDRAALNYGVDLGSLFALLSDEPERISKLGAGEKNGSLELRLQRTHEWEEVVEIIITGAGASAAIFCAAVIKELGSVFGKWLSKQIGNGNGDSNPIIKTDNMEVSVSRDIKLEDIERIIEMFNKNSKNGNIIYMIADPQVMQE